MITLTIYSPDGLSKKMSEHTTIAGALGNGDGHACDIRCSDCQLARINRTYCHETGCPEAWRDTPKPCGFCGGDFIPEFRTQFLCADCAAIQAEWETEALEDAQADSEAARAERVIEALDDIDETDDNDNEP
jgi:hypothetical protein